jgi:hypothetical protein
LTALNPCNVKIKIAPPPAEFVTARRFQTRTTS